MLQGLLDTREIPKWMKVILVICKPLRSWIGSIAGSLVDLESGVDF
jgi:hypothetical protein